MRLSAKIGFHAAARGGQCVRPDAEVAVAKQAKNRRRTEVPTGPGERCIAIHVIGVDARARVEQQLDSFFVPESGGAV